ncbi:hypothetical protein BV898_15364 [Hypsibius exemplaris]|uniref:Uncharacterized protein n=1 Tax=Hypsibius exemplaris TaxID=2072580 RepID=A0A9X6NHP2_HYPEX|nr:hypothetical protein BV898_15364 [Hypsibius exemplaris]
MQYLLCILAMALGVAYAHDGEQSCHAERKACTWEGVLAFQQTTTFLANDLNDFNEKALLTTCRTIEAAVKRAVDYEARCVEPHHHTIPASWIGICADPRLIEKAGMMTSCVGMARGKAHSVCLLEATRSIHGLLSKAVSMLVGSGASSPAHEDLGNAICCTAKRLVSCHRPIFQEKCTGSAFKSSIAGNAGVGPIELLDNLTSSLFTAFKCDGHGSCPATDAVLPNALKEQHAIYEHGDGHSSDDVLGESCDAKRCWSPLLELSDTGIQLYTTYLQNQIYGASKPFTLEPSLAITACKKIQKSMGCIGKFVTKCLTFPFAYLKKVGANILRTSEMCHNPDLHSKIALLWACQAGSAKGIMKNEQDRVLKLTNALIHMIHSSPAHIVSLFMGDMSGVQRLLCCHTREMLGYFDPVYASCGASATALWSDIKASSADILVCDAAVLASCPISLVQEWEAVEQTRDESNTIPKDSSGQFSKN